jgi:hypothetical protein
MSGLEGIQGEVRGMMQHSLWLMDEGGLLLGIVN